MISVNILVQNFDIDVYLTIVITFINLFCHLVNIMKDYNHRSNTVYQLQYKNNKTM